MNIPNMFLPVTTEIQMEITASKKKVDWGKCEDEWQKQSNVVL